MNLWKKMKLVEITPKNIRLRKKILDNKNKRKNGSKIKKIKEEKNMELS